MRFGEVLLARFGVFMNGTSEVFSGSAHDGSNFTSLRKTSVRGKGGGARGDNGRWGGRD